LLYEFTSKMDRFVTLALTVLDPATHTVTIVSAGHQSPLLYRKSDRSMRDAMPNDLAGVPLGITDGYPFESHQIKLELGDTLLVFTDGVPESMSVAMEAFGSDGIEKALQEPGDATPKALGERLIKAVQQHAAGRAAPHDDVTLVCFGRMS
jgi:serine phosphatase RsbU (regulator of sigma subunit)